MHTSDEPPCDLAAFIAERHGLDLSEAQALLAQWLEHYEPRCVTTARPNAQPLVTSSAAGVVPLPITPELEMPAPGTMLARRRA
jgi:hypothetical protein